MIRIDFSKIAVTVWFFVGAFAICGFFTVDAFTAQIVSANEDLRFWAWTAVTTCGAATVSGLIVDLVLYAASVAWTRTAPYEVTLQNNRKSRLA